MLKKYGYAYAALLAGLTPRLSNSTPNMYTLRDHEVHNSVFTLLISCFVFFAFALRPTLSRSVLRYFSAMLFLTTVILAVVSFVLGIVESGIPTWGLKSCVYDALAQPAQIAPTAPPNNYEVNPANYIPDHKTDYAVPEQRQQRSDTFG